MLKVVYVSYIVTQAYREIPVAKKDSGHYFASTLELSARSAELVLRKKFPGYSA